MKKKIIVGLMAFLIASAPRPARADIWGGDVAVLIQILANALQQLAQLRQVVSTGRDSLDLVREINRGINDALRLGQTISPDRDPGLYREWKRLEAASRGVDQVYGTVPDSPMSRVQKDTDQSVAEAITLNNSIYDFTGRIDEIGDEIKAYSHVASPGGAAKVTAESLGVMLHVQNEMLRAQATGMKIQAQSLALQNRKDKDETRHYLENSKSLVSALKSQDVSFTVPRF
jgi:hypothetical protein